MSYILDALRRADAERERGRGKVPGLYTTQLPGGAADWAPAPSRPPWLAITIGIGATVLLIGGVAAWMAFSREPAPMVVTVVNPAPSSLLPPDVPTAVANPAVAAPAPVAPTPGAVLPSTAEPAAAPTKPAAKAPPAAASASGTVKPARPTAPPRPASAAPDAATAKATPAKTAPAELPARRAAASPATPPAAASAPAPASAAAAATAAKPPRVPTLAELPADIRQQLPTLAVGGAMYSPTPSNRMLILNGQLYHEGEQPAPGLTLESIQLRSAVLSFKGQRYEISY
jgi:general secretion pathway protein B